MSSAAAYPINPDRDVPWNNLPDLPIATKYWRTPDVLEQLGRAQEALGRLYGRSVAIPNQGLLVTSISLQEAKASSAIENIFTTDDARRAPGSRPRARPRRCFATAKPCGAVTNT